MITLYQLRQLAKDEYPDAVIDLVLLLMVWAKRDPENELAALLQETRLNKDQMFTALEPIKHTGSTADTALLAECITQAKDGMVTGAQVLKKIAETPQNRIHQTLLALGIDWPRLIGNLRESGDGAQGTLAHCGIAVDKAANPLLQYGRDLTGLAETGEFDALCDRPEEIDWLLEVLLRKQKGNAVLTGPAGVGKTALVELFARYLVRGNVPSLLQGTRIYEISMGKMVAGTRYRGDFEERMDQVIEAVQACEPAMLFIDELHLIWGAGRAEGVITDAANILKPFLARGTIRVIGATTVEEYHRYIERDPALARRFQAVHLDEPSDSMTGQMVQAQAKALAEHHGIVIPDPVITQAIQLTNQHIINRFQPDKTVDL